MILPIRISKLSDSVCFQHKVLHQHNYDEVDMENVGKLCSQAIPASMN